MISSTFEWWMIPVAILVVGLVMSRLSYLANVKMMEEMFNDGLTEEDIKDILGTQGYNKARG